ncbi:MAG: phosphatidate cytidylyltransferase [Oscillospiraceae bacterium]|nr:phosphatidate cytidylyltransferase [Oscillospiraceae bacterium]
MKVRIITSIITLPLLLVVLIVLPPLFTALLMMAMCAVAAYELLWSTGYVRQLRLLIYTMIAAAGTALWSYLGSPHGWGLAGIIVFGSVLYGEMLLSKAKLPFSKVALCFVGGLLIPYLLSSIMRLRIMELGRVYVLLPFVMAFMSDTCAYFTGRFLGRHKLAPTISPKKTVEGLFGGMAGAVLGMIIYSLVLMLAFDQRVNFLYAIVYGVLGSLASVLGDLTFSVIKRQTGIKDYGKLIPGHGGVLDRFDSMTVVAPVAETLLIILPIAENIHG